MFLRANKLSLLDVYLTAVENTCGQPDPSGAYAECFFGERGFLRWSWRKHDVGHPPYRLDHYLETAGGDEEKALAVFFNDLVSFQAGMEY